MAASQEIDSWCLAAGDPLIQQGQSMNWDIIEGNWKQFKGVVKQKWGKLTDDNLDTIAGKRVELAGRLQETYGITKDQAEVQVKAFEELHKDYQPTQLRAAEVSSPRQSPE